MFPDIWDVKEGENWILEGTVPWVHRAQRSRTPGCPRVPVLSHCSVEAVFLV